MAKTLFMIAALVALVAGASAQSNFHNCGNGGDKAKLTSLTFNPNIVKGTKAPFTMKGTFNEQITKGATLNLIGIVGGLKLKFPGFNTDACSNGLSCPVAAGAFTWDITLDINKDWPSLKNVPVLIEAHDAGGSELFCAGVEVNLVSGEAAEEEVAALTPAMRDLHKVVADRK